MVIAIVLLLLALLGYALWKASRDPGPSHHETRPSRPARQAPPPNPRFGGRIVQPDAPTAVHAARRRPSRLRNGAMVSPIKNGQLVTRSDAIGLACLAPISECTSGEDCLCLTAEERRRRPAR